jgi:hypothetical protein
MSRYTKFGVAIENEFTYKLCMTYCLLSQKLQRVLTSCHFEVRYE